MTLLAVLLPALLMPLLLWLAPASGAFRGGAYACW